MNHPSVLAASPALNGDDTGGGSTGRFLGIEDTSKLQLAEEMTRYEEEMERRRFEEEIKRMEDMIHTAKASTGNPPDYETDGSDEEDEYGVSYDASESTGGYDEEEEEEEIIVEDDYGDEYYDDGIYEEEIIEEIVDDDDEYEDDYYEEEVLIEDDYEEEILEYADSADEGYEDFGGHESCMMQGGQDFNASATWDIGSSGGDSSAIANNENVPPKGRNFLGDIASAANAHNNASSAAVVSAVAPGKPVPVETQTSKSTTSDIPAQPAPMKSGNFLDHIASAATARTNRLEDDNGELKMKEFKPEVEAQVRPMDAFDLTAMVSQKARERETRLEAGGEKRMTAIKSKKEIKEDFKSIVVEAAQLGRLTRLNEHVVEAVAVEKTAQEEWRSKGLLAIQWRTQHMAVIHEAARAGAASRLPEKIVSNCEEEAQDDFEYDEHNAKQLRVSQRMKQLLQLKAEVGTGQHKVDSLILNRKEERAKDGRDTLVKPMQCYTDLDLHNIKLPRRKAPKIDPNKEYEKIKEKFKGTYRQDKPLSNISNEVAERAWSRRTRLDRPGSMPRVTEICNCPYCLDPSPYQTHAYIEKDKERKQDGYESPDSEEERLKARELRRIERRKNRPQRGAPRGAGVDGPSSTPSHRGGGGATATIDYTGGGPISVGNRVRSFDVPGPAPTPNSAYPGTRGPPRFRTSNQPGAATPHYGRSRSSSADSSVGDSVGGDAASTASSTNSASPYGFGSVPEGPSPADVGTPGPAGEPKLVRRRVRPQATGAGSSLPSTTGGGTATSTPTGVVRRRRPPGTAPGARPTRVPPGGSATATGSTPGAPGQRRVASTASASSNPNSSNSAGSTGAATATTNGTSVAPGAAPTPGTRKVIRRRRRVDQDPQKGTMATSSEWNSATATTTTAAPSNPAPVSEGTTTTTEADRLAARRANRQVRPGSAAARRAPPSAGGVRPTSSATAAISPTTNASSSQPGGATATKVIPSSSGSQITEQVITRPDGSRVVRKVVTGGGAGTTTVTKKVIRTTNGRKTVQTIQTSAAAAPSPPVSAAPSTGGGGGTTTSATTTSSTTRPPVAGRRTASSQRSITRKTADPANASLAQLPSAAAPPRPALTASQSQSSSVSSVVSAGSSTPTVTVTRDNSGRVVTTTTTTTRKMASSGTIPVKRGLFGRKKA